MEQLRKSFSLYGSLFLIAAAVGIAPALAAKEISVEPSASLQQLEFYQRKGNPPSQPKPITHVNLLHYLDVPGTFNAGTAQGAIQDIIDAINEWKTHIDTPDHPCPKMQPSVVLTSEKVQNENNIYFSVPTNPDYPFDPTVAAYTVITIEDTPEAASEIPGTFPVTSKTKATIYLNSAKSFNNSGYGFFPYFSKWRLDKVLKHELGHLLGLTHSTSDSLSIMNPSNIAIGTAAKYVQPSDGDLAHKNNCL